MIKISEWLAALPKNACIGLDEFAGVLGVSRDVLRGRVYKGLKDMPKPDFNTRYAHSKNRVKIMSRGRGSLKWKAVTVRNYIRHLNRIEKQEEIEK